MKVYTPDVLVASIGSERSVAEPVHVGYRADIDGLRTIAVLSVVAFHAFPHLLKGGFVGVDIFFVLSGFLISSIIIKNLDRGSFGFFDFYSRRIARIFPALILVLVACMFTGWFVLLPGEYTQLGKHVSAGSGFISNLVLLRESGYFDNAAETKPLLHLWSLGVEEQFYILWPILLYGAFRFRVNAIALISCLIAVSFILNIYGSHVDASANFYSPQTRFWELLAGAGYAWLSLNKLKPLHALENRLSSSLNYILGILWIRRDDLSISDLKSIFGVWLIAASVYLIDKNDVFPGWWALMPVLGTLFVISAGNAAWINRCILSSKPFVWCGLISFPLYLWHWPLLSFAQIIQDAVPTREIKLWAVALAFMLAWLTYVLIETPLKKKKNTPVKIGSLFLAMVSVGAFGYYTFVNGGFSQRMSKFNDAITIIENPFPTIEQSHCSSVYPELAQYNFDGGCVMNKKEPAEILLLGDSHMNHYRTAFWDALPDRPVLMVVQFSCFPFASDVFRKGDCEYKSDSMISFIENSKSIKQVYVSGYWEYLITGDFSATGSTWRTSQKFNAKDWETFKKNAVNFISRVQASGKEIVFLKNIPSLNFDIKSCYDARPFRLAPPASVVTDCSTDYDTYMSIAKSYNDAIDSMLSKYPDVKVYDPVPLFCANGRCAASDKKLPYYLNGDHLNWYGSAMVIKDMMSKVPLSNGSLYSK